MKFKYSTAVRRDGTALKDSRGRMVKRPMVELELKNKNGQKITTLAVIDSGADTTTLNIQYADFLGIKIDKTKSQEILGIGAGRVLTYPGTFIFRLKAMDIELEVPAWYVDSENVNILLGQEVFFEKFRIKFEKDHDTFEVNPVK